MRVGELKELLEDVDDELELRIAHQPNWPLALTVAGVRVPGDDFEVPCPYHNDFLVGHVIDAKQAEDVGFVEGEPCPEEPEDDPREGRQHVWIVGIDHPWDESPYAPRWVFQDE